MKVGVILKMADAIQLAKPRKNVLLTGLPGVGKTTLIKKVCEKLEDLRFGVQGFYTEELREDGQRTGFDVVDLDGKRGPLARVVDRDNPTQGRSYMVGRYNVRLQSFETVALPSIAVKPKVECHKAIDIQKQLRLLPETCTKAVVIDEIGKMELFSQSFVQNVKQLLKHPKVTVLATIPAKGKGNPFVEEIRNRDDVLVYTVTKENRYSLIEEVADAVKDSLETYG